MVDGMSVNWHPCLLIEASPHDGPMPAGMTFDIQKDNNIAQRNIEILNPGEPTADFSVIIVGTSDSSGVAKLVIDHSNISDKKRVLIRFTDKEMMARLLEHAKKVNMSIEKYKGIEVIAVARGKQPTEVAIKLKQNQFTPLLVAVPGRTIDREKEEELRITQLRNDGTLSAGYTMIV